MKKTALLLTFLFTAFVCFSQSIVHNQTDTPKIQIPDIPGYLTLKCDFHMHTVFSDGLVWPNVRVEEALAEGLDVISVTDHVEYSPHKQVEPDKAIPSQMAIAAAKNKTLIVIPGGEFSATPDHFNGIFMQDQNLEILKDKDPEIRVKAACAQGAFVFWNHPGWTSRSKEGMAPEDERFYKMMKEGLIQGIEVANGKEYYQECFEVVEKYHLVFIGNSDIHGVSHYAYLPEDHRTVTLVFAEEKSEEGVKDALLNRRTLVYQGDHLIGRDEFLEPLFKSCLDISTKYIGQNKIATMTITNISDIPFHCENLGEYSFFNSPHFFTLPAHATTTLAVKTREVLKNFDLVIKVYNMIDGPGESLITKIQIVAD